jgi:hypothetical protein
MAGVLRELAQTFERVSKEPVSFPDYTDMDINGKNFSLRRSGYASSSLVNHNNPVLELTD